MARSRKRNDTIFVGQIYKCKGVRLSRVPFSRLFVTSLNYHRILFCTLQVEDNAIDILEHMVVVWQSTLEEKD